MLPVLLRPKRWSVELLVDVQKANSSSSSSKLRHVSKRTQSREKGQSLDDILAGANKLIKKVVKFSPVLISGRELAMRL